MSLKIKIEFRCNIVVRGPFQPILDIFPRSMLKGTKRSFSYCRFKLYVKRKYCNSKAKSDF